MIPSATARAPWSLRRWLRAVLSPPAPLSPSWHRQFVEVATAIVEAAVRRAAPPQPTQTVGDVRDVMPQPHALAFTAASQPRHPALPARRHQAPAVEPNVTAHPVLDALSISQLCWADARTDEGATAPCSK